jgi:hypothetical protein
VAERSEPNGRRNAAVVALAMKFEKLLAAVAVLGEGLDQGRPIFDKLLAGHGRAAVRDVACTIAGQISAPAVR